MNVTTRLLEIEGNHGAGMHPFQVRPLRSELSSRADEHVDFVCPHGDHDDTQHSIHVVGGDTIFSLRYARSTVAARTQRDRRILWGLRHVLYG